MRFIFFSSSGRPTWRQYSQILLKKFKKNTQKKLCSTVHGLPLGMPTELGRDFCLAATRQAAAGIKRACTPYWKPAHQPRESVDPASYQSTQPSLRLLPTWQASPCFSSGPRHTTGLALRCLGHAQIPPTSAHQALRFQQAGCWVQEEEVSRLACSRIVASSSRAAGSRVKAARPNMAAP